ncbi:hypothetical protein ABZ352_35570 [Streptomyces griseofuscus]|uniref:hypothetical protein n=1 Tax=Streptomyces griseofuscus TaxID=146922 RepID=UPI0033CE2E14
MAFYRDEDGAIWADCHATDGLRCIVDPVRGLEDAGLVGVLTPRSVVEFMGGRLVEVRPTWEEVA